MPQIHKQTNELEIWHTNGLGDTFDPRVDFPAYYAGKVYWEMSTLGANGEAVVPVTSGAEIDFKPQGPGPHRAILKGIPVDELTHLYMNGDKISTLITGDWLNRLSGAAVINLITNEELAGDISTFRPRGGMRSVRLSATGISGDVCWNIPGSMTDIWLHRSNISLSAELKFDADNYPYLNSIRYEDCGLPMSGVGNIIIPIWTNRVKFTSVSGSISVGGNNSSPDGTVAAPPGGEASNDDWAWVTDHYVPLTVGAMIYDLQNDVNTEGFRKWTVTYANA